MKNEKIDACVDDLKRMVAEEAKWDGLLELTDEGYNVTINGDVSFMTDKANASGRWSVVRTCAPFCTKDGTRIWSGPTPQAAFDKAQKQFAKEFRL